MGWPHSRIPMPCNMDGGNDSAASTVHVLELIMARSITPERLQGPKAPPSIILQIINWWQHRDKTCLRWKPINTYRTRGGQGQMVNTEQWPRCRYWSRDCTRCMVIWLLDHVSGQVSGHLLLFSSLCGGNNIYCSFSPWMGFSAQRS